MVKLNNNFLKSEAKKLLITVLRTLIMYLFVVGALRLMGKRQIGELEASELVVTIIISDIAAMPITNTDVPIAANVIAILMLMILEVVLSFIAFKNPRARRIMYGRPSTFYKDGKFNQKEMESRRFNIADIMEEVRGNGASALSEVEYIVMETNGKVSVVLKSGEGPITPKQLEMNTEPVRMSYIIIDNGKIIHECMKKLGLDEDWLGKKLKEKGLSSAKDVFYLSVDQNTGKTVLIPKG